MVLSKEVIKANIAFHTALSESYNSLQPFFRPENVERVDKLLCSFVETTGNNLFLDVACGTGFMLGIAYSHFDFCVGLDITPGMLTEARKTLPDKKNILLCLADANYMPFRDKLFDLCSIYGSLHHFAVLEPSLREVYRLLKGGGIFYSDQDPNFYCFRDLKALKDVSVNSSILMREIDAVNRVDVRLKEKYGIDERTTRFAEFQKLIKSGLKKEVLDNTLKKIGFKEINSQYRWYLGQGHHLHHVSADFANSVEEYLRSCLPLSKNLFKYFYITASKPQDEIK